MNNIESYLRDDLLEGIGNEVLLGGICLIFLLGFSFLLIKRNGNVTRVSRIHPSNFVAVNDARNVRSNETNSSSHGSPPLGSQPFAVNGPRRYGSMDGNCPVCLNSLHLPIETNCGHLFCGRCIIIYWQHAQWRGGPIRCPVCRQKVNIMFPCFPTSAHSRNATDSASSLISSISNATSEWINYFISFFYSPSSPSTTSRTTSSDSTNLNTTDIATNNSATNGNSLFHSAPQPDDLLRQSTSTPSRIEEPTSVIREINRYNRSFSGEPRPWSDYLYDLPTLLRHLINDFFSFNGLMYMFRIRIVLCVVAAIMYLISPLDMIPEAVFGIFGLFDDIIVVLLLAIYVTIIYRRFLSSRWEIE